MISYQYYYVIGSVLVVTSACSFTLEKILTRSRHKPFVVKAKNWSDAEKKIKRWILKEHPKNKEVEKLQTSEPYYSGVGALMFEEGKRCFIFELPSSSMKCLPAEISSERRNHIVF